MHTSYPGTSEASFGLEAVNLRNPVHRGYAPVPQVIFTPAEFPALRDRVTGGDVTRLYTTGKSLTNSQTQLLFRELAVHLPGNKP
jgi:hypothetical protein